MSKAAIDPSIEAYYPPPKPVQEMMEVIMRAIDLHTKDDERGIDGDVVINAMLACLGAVALACPNGEELSRIAAAIHHFVDYEIPADRAMVARFRAMMRQAQRLADAPQAGHA